jgi:hypothetical protein
MNAFSLLDTGRYREGNGKFVPGEFPIQAKIDTRKRIN